MVNVKRKICTEKRLTTSLKDLSIALNNLGQHGFFSFLNSLPISVLRNLELEANKLCDRVSKLYKAALLTRCYVQHFLSRYIDSEINHKRHFIKIPFINKDIEFIDLHSIFNDNWPLGSRLWCILWVCHFPIGILGQVWYLIVSIPDLCTLTYF